MEGRKDRGENRPPSLELERAPRGLCGHTTLVKEMEGTNLSLFKRDNVNFLLEIPLRAEMPVRLARVVLLGATSQIRPARLRGCAEFASGSL